MAASWPAFETLLAAGRETVRARLRLALKFPHYCPAPGEVDQSTVDTELDSMLERRRNVLGNKLYLFYDRPLHMVRREGVWLYDATGPAYLDAYNNVPHLVHSPSHVLRPSTPPSAAFCATLRHPP